MYLGVIVRFITLFYQLIPPMKVTDPRKIIHNYMSLTVVTNNVINTLSCDPCAQQWDVCGLI